MDGTEHGHSRAGNPHCGRLVGRGRGGRSAADGGFHRPGSAAGRGDRTPYNWVVGTGSAGSGKGIDPGSGPSWELSRITPGPDRLRYRAGPATPAGGIRGRSQPFAGSPPSNLERDWVVVELEVSKHDDDDFRRDISARLRSALLELSPKARWTDRFQHAAAVLKSFTISVDAAGAMSAGLDVEAAEGFADHANLSLDLTDVFLALGAAAQERGRGVVVLLDEVQFLRKTQLEALIEALHKMIQRKLPITMVGAGLPQIAELAGDAKSYAERLFKFPAIDNLPPDDAKAALSRPAQDEGVEFTTDALEEAVAITGGYPYFIQELRYAVWTVADGPVINLGDVQAAVPAYEAKLDASFFRVRLDRATDLQRAYLRAMAQLGLLRKKPQTSPTLWADCRPTSGRPERS